MSDSIFEAETLGLRVNSVSANVDFRDLQRLRDVMQAALGVARNDSIMDAIGGLLVGQSRNRITDEKSDADGEAWAPWSPAYAKTRKPPQSLLQDTETLLNAIDAEHFGDEITVFVEDVAYAGAQNFGYTPNNLPARPYLGVSAENLSEIETLVLSYLSDVGGGRRRDARGRFA